MHPHFGQLSSYFMMWVAATIVCGMVGAKMAIEDGSPVKRLAVGAFLFGLVIVGAKLHYLAESILFPGDDFVPPELRNLSHGFRIPGGILLVAVGIPVACAVANLDWRSYGDRFVLLLCLMLFLVRIGCFLNGCCFGKPSTLPISVVFPRNTAAFYYQASIGAIDPLAAHATLPVIPLQLLFAGAASVLFLVLKLAPVQPPGGKQLLFFALFFSSSAALEPLRGYPLSLNAWLLYPLAVALTLIASSKLKRRPPKAMLSSH
jgi:prolipoprotein diacylglyceryltransferase